jgi:cyclohexadieny/prephenate dehydrogenase
LSVGRLPVNLSKTLQMKELRNISVIGLGLLGGSIALTARQRLPGTRVIGYSHRAPTRAKARNLGIGTEIADDLAVAVRDADLVIVATPIFTFEEYFAQISTLAPDGCIVTDVGSTKVLPHRWAAQKLDKRLHYVGSHPVAGSEQRGVEFARDDLFYQACCVLTVTPGTSRSAVKPLRAFWSALGCSICVMDPVEHDRIVANISHLPHVLAAGLVNASNGDDLKLAGKGFLDSTRIASGPSTIWTDVLLANRKNIADGIDHVIAELSKLKAAIKGGKRPEIEQLLEAARRKRASLVNYKIKRKELLS